MPRCKPALGWGAAGGAPRLGAGVREGHRQPGAAEPRAQPWGTQRSGLRGDPGGSAWAAGKPKGGCHGDQSDPVLLRALRWGVLAGGQPRPRVAWHGGQGSAPPGLGAVQLRGQIPVHLPLPRRPAPTVPSLAGWAPHVRSPRCLLLPPPEARAPPVLGLQLAGSPSPPLNSDCKLSQVSARGLCCRIFLQR